MKISQTHQMKVIFWISLPILIITLGLLTFTSTTNNAQDLYSLIPPTLIVFGVMYLLFSIKLQWELSETHFSFTYKPFVWKPKNIPMYEISHLELCKINPLRDFGGWGLRYSKKYGKAYTTEGNWVLRLHLKSNKMLNFTATKSTDLEQLLETLSNKTLD